MPYESIDLFKIIAILLFTKQNIYAIIHFMGEGNYSTYEVRVSAIKAVLNNQPISSITKTYNIDRSTLYRWRIKYSKNKDLRDLSRRPGSGRKRILKQDELDRLKEIVLQPAAQFNYETDFWTCRRLIQVIKSELNIEISQPTTWRMLRSLDLTYQKPKRRYHESNDALRKDWLENELPIILATVKKYKAILYFEDESNISLTAVLGKTWAPKGKTPIQKVTGSRASVSAMSAISKSGRLIFTLHEKRIASKEIIHFLEQMLKHHKRRHLVVVMDKAPPHTSKMTKEYISTQKRLHVFYLPPYSPDFNPDEQVWNYLKNEELKSHQARTKDEIKMLAQNKLESMSKNPKLLRGLFFRCDVAILMN